MIMRLHVKTVLSLLVANVAVAASSTPPQFNHSWSTLPVFWFSANTSGYENPAETAIIAKFPIAILAWQLGTQADPKFRHAEDKLHNQAAMLATTAPNTEVLVYVQGQLALNWYEYQRAMLPPPCGTDLNGTYTDYFLKGPDGTPAQWPGSSPDCPHILNYNFSQAKVRDHFVNEIVTPTATAPNIKGIWFDDTDWLACNDMCNEVHDMHLQPCDMNAKTDVFDGIVQWKTDVATSFNARGQIPIFSSINSWNETSSQHSCTTSEKQLTQELAGLSYGRFYEGWSGSCDDIWNAKTEAEAGIAVFINQVGVIEQYVVAAFLMTAGNQSFFASSTCWVDPCTTWHSQFYDQPLGAPKGPAVSEGTKWTREFEHTTVSLDCSAKTSTISGWPSPPPTPPPPPPPPPAPLPPKPVNGKWSAQAYCTACHNPPLINKGTNFNLTQCENYCVGDAQCTFINYAYSNGACMLFAGCDAPWHFPNCKGNTWWTTLEYGR
eukprot:m.11044 g.11044  ORF g.11044 m.11044 type:complete len:492 (-) comp8613_c0_seq2:135-1610(-)